METTAETSQQRVLFRRWTIKLLRERAILGFLFLSASVAVVATLAIFLTLLINGLDFFQDVSLWEFFTGTNWAPDFLPPQFGMLPLLKATLLIGVAATVLGVPFGIGTAIYLSEYAPARVRSVAKPAVEILAGIPSIIFGIVALFTISPILQASLNTPVFNALNAIIMLGVMVVPIIATISEDALRTVPAEMRSAAYALGSTKWETTWSIVLPAASSGVFAGVLLGLGRAIGETMVVTMAAGLVSNMSFNPLDPMQTITAFIANRAGGDLPTGSVLYVSIFAVGTVLFVVTYAVNVLADRVLVRQRKKFGL
jgi:phosphate transport system permease protein